MAIAFDSSGTPASGTGNFSFTHTPVGTVRAVIIGIMQNVGATDEVTAVSYGGVALSRVGAVFHTTGEPGAVYLYFLGASIPTGAQTVSVTVNGTGSTKRVTVWALTAGADTEVVASDTTINSDSQANPSVTLGLMGRSCWCGIEFFSGQNAPTGITPFASWTATLEQDFGSQTGGSYRYNTIGTADVSAGWTQTAEDAAMVAVAIGEVVAGGSAGFRARATHMIGGAF